MARIFYTGVGSRRTPYEILDLMRRLAVVLRGMGYTLRSGGAFGADSVFKTGAGMDSIIYRPEMATPEAMEIARRFHPAWGACTEYAQRLHARNSFQVLGRSLSNPSQFLICWTPDGAISHRERTRNTGGTGTAISIADHYQVEVINLRRDDHLRRIRVDFSL